MPHRTAKQIATISAIVGLSAGGAVAIVQTTTHHGGYGGRSGQQVAEDKGREYDAWQTRFETTDTYTTADSSTDPCALAYAAQAARVDPDNVPPVDPADWKAGFADYESGLTEACTNGDAYDALSPAEFARVQNGRDKLTAWQMEVRKETRNTAHIHTNQVWPNTSGQDY